MKRTLFLIVILTGFSTVYSQNYDLIVTTNGDSIACLIDSATNAEIYFKMKAQNNWIHTYLDRSSIRSYQMNAVDRKNVTFKQGTSIISIHRFRKNAVSFGIAGTTPAFGITYERLLFQRICLEAGVGFALSYGIGIKFYVPKVRENRFNIFGGFTIGKLINLSEWKYYYIPIGITYYGWEGFLFSANIGPALFIEDWGDPYFYTETIIPYGNIKVGFRF